MARIRTIKPEFWQHEDLSELAPETHMLAAALLNQSDDEGYFKANHKLIKAACFPLREDSMSIHDSLICLSNIGYLELFNGSDGKQYGKVIKFTIHQTISRPTPSKIKDLRATNEDSMSTPGVIHEDSTPERKGKEQGKEGKGKELSSSGDDVTVAFDLYNFMAREAGLPLAQILSDTRKIAIRSRLKECGGIDGWSAAMDAVAKSDFLTGGGSRGWKADIDFIIKKQNFIKIMEGGHNNGGGGRSKVMAALDEMEGQFS